MTEQTLVREPYEVRSRWVLWIGGILSILVGIAAIVYPFAAALGFEIFIGAALVVVGGFELVRAFTLRKWGRILGVVVYGLLALAAGIVLLLYPLPGVAAVSIVVAAYLVAGGIVKMWAAFNWRTRPGSPWLMLSGILSLILGGLLIAMMPIGAIWGLGILIGVDLLFLGVSQLVFASRSTHVPKKARR